MLIREWGGQPTMGQQFEAEGKEAGRRVVDAIAWGFWRWYEAHEDDRVAGFWFITVRVRDLRWLFVEIFGAP